LQSYQNYPSKVGVHSKTVCTSSPCRCEPSLAVTCGNLLSVRLNLLHSASILFKALQCTYMSPGPFFRFWGKVASSIASRGLRSSRSHQTKMQRPLSYSTCTCIKFYLRTRRAQGAPDQPGLRGCYREWKPSHITKTKEVRHCD